MRENRFRAYFVSGQKWEYFDLEDLIKGKLIQMWPLYENWYEDTGLHDKHEREIYEGDIVHIVIEYKDGRKYDKGKWEVHWNYDCWHLKNGNVDFDNGDYYRGDDVYWCDAKIIGNVFENPELLEDNK